MAKSAIINLSDTPTLPLLTFIETSESSGEGLRIIERISAKHRALGVQLLDDKQGEVTDALVANHPNDVNEVTRDIFKKWLTTRGRRPITWATFIAVLKEIGLNQLAGDIEILAGSTPGDEPTAANDDDIVKSKPLPPDQDDIVVLEKEIKGFNQRFNSIKISTIRCLEKCGIAVTTVVMFLTSLLGVGESRKFLKEEHKSLRKCEDHGELFDELNFHWNLLSYRLLQGLLESLSAENEEFNKVNKKMEKYDKDMSIFRAKTLLALFCKVSPNLLLFNQTTKPPRPKFTMLVIKHNWPESITLQHVEEFRIRFSNVFGLPECAMMVYEIRTGSFEITWLVILPPASLVSSVRSQRAIIFFKQFRVTSISLDGAQIYREHSYLQAKIAISDTSSVFSIDSGVGSSMHSGASSSSSSHVSSSMSSPRSAHLSQRQRSPWYTHVPRIGKPTPDTSSVSSPRSTHLSQRQRTSDEKFATARPGNVLSVRCHEKKRALVQMIRGSATSDSQFAYFTPLGFSSIYQYEYTTEKWERLPQCPYHDSGLANINNELTTVGGWDGLHRTNKLMTLRQEEWVEEYPPMKTRCSYPAVVTTSDGNYLFVIGGRVGGRWVGTVEIFQMKTRKWYTVTDLPKPLYPPSATICGNQLNVIGNGDGFSCSLQDLPSSDQPITSPLLLSWTPLPPLPVGSSTAATLRGQLVLIGGEQGGSPVNSIHQLIDGQWKEIVSMAKRRWRCLVTNQSPDKILIVGGYGALDSIEECTAVVV